MSGGRERTKTGLSGFIGIIGAATAAHGIIKKADVMTQKSVKIEEVTKAMALHFVTSVVEEIKKAGHEIKMGNTGKGNAAIVLPWATWNEAGELVVKAE